jgi:hypothetical protein
MSRVPPPKQPNGCLQTFVITRMIAQILFVPMLLIGGAVLCVAAAVYAFSVNYLYGVAVIASAIVVLLVISRWEYTRVKRELPPPDEVDPADPRAR